MTATVVSLASRRRNPAPACTCPRHSLDALADRIRAALDDTEGELLIPRDHLADALADLVTTTDRLLPQTERTKP